MTQSRRSRRLAIGAVAALAVVLPAGLAWACVAPVSLTTSSPTVQPGGMVHVIGRETAPGAPIDIRLDSPDGPVLLTVLAGTLTLREAGTERTYAAGTFWTETPGQVHMAGNRGTTTARVSAVYLVPKGAPVATTVQVPSGGLPATGENAAPAVLGLLVAVGLSLVVCGRLVRHRDRGAS